MNPIHGHLWLTLLQVSSPAELRRCAETVLAAFGRSLKGDDDYVRRRRPECGSRFVIEAAIRGTKRKSKANYSLYLSQSVSKSKKI